MGVGVWVGVSVGGCEWGWCLFTVAIFLQPAATFVVAWFVVYVFLSMIGGKFFELITVSAD